MKLQLGHIQLHLSLLSPCHSQFVSFPFFPTNNRQSGKQFCLISSLNCSRPAVAIAVMSTLMCTSTSPHSPAETPSVCRSALVCSDHVHARRAAGVEHAPDVRPQWQPASLEHRRGGAWQGKEHKKGKLCVFCNKSYGGGPKDIENYMRGRT